MKSLKHKCYVMNSFPILFGRQSRHIGRTLFRAWTVTSGDWSTSWASVMDVRLRVTIMNPAKTWWPQLTSTQCFNCIQGKGPHMIFMHVTFCLKIVRKFFVKITLRFLHEIHACYFSSLSHAKNSHEIRANFKWDSCEPLLLV